MAFACHYICSPVSISGYVTIHHVLFQLYHQNGSMLEIPSITDKQSFVVVVVDVARCLRECVRASVCVRVCVCV